VFHKFLGYRARETIMSVHPNARRMNARRADNTPSVVRDENAPPLRGFLADRKDSQPGDAGENLGATDVQSASQCPNS
jgi:hypothetical protein